MEILNAVACVVGWFVLASVAVVAALYVLGQDHELP